MSSFINTLNLLSRLYNKFVMSFISLSILILLSSVKFEAKAINTKLRTLIFILWFTFVIISSLYTINGILVNREFKSELYRYQRAGKPLKGVRGYSELMESISNSKNNSILISLASILSLLIFIWSIFGNSLVNDRTITSIAIAMAFISVSVVFLVKFPEGSVMEVGGLVSFYEPDSYPMSIDNLLTDVIMTYLDPITFMSMDNWTKGLQSYLRDDYESESNIKIRIDRAKEKIFLMTYLSNSIPETVTEDVIADEIEELVGIENLDPFMNGVESGLTWDDIRTIVKLVEKQSPDAFRLVDRLLINLMDNYLEFKNRDLYFTVGAQINQGSVIESSGLIAFFLNNTDNPNRKLNVVFRSDSESIHPHYQKISLTLDPLTTPYPDEQPDFIADGDDIISLLSILLQVGDAIWWRFKPKGFGFRIITVQAEEDGTANVMGRSIEMKFTKSISWYIRTLAPKLSALGGLALPIINTFF